MRLQLTAPAPQKSFLLDSESPCQCISFCELVLAQETQVDPASGRQFKVKPNVRSECFCLHLAACCATATSDHSDLDSDFRDSRPGAYWGLGPDLGPCTVL